ncbi:MAG: D-aminoacylase [Candidatus Moranbacteria bacterium]|nr:D-aminoacylase [Candidatus Moranbacteria bacterium]
MIFDVIIQGGTLIDGTGDPMVKNDIGIKNERIEKIGDLSNDGADIVIDASGKYVTPGFVDVGNHSDSYWRVFSDPDLESLVYQGITTIVGGNCGSSVAPLMNQEMIASVQKWADVSGINLDWLSISDLLSHLEKNPLSVNFATLVGHSTIRRGLIRDEMRELTKDEMETLKEVLRMALQEGAIGMSSGLVYSHAKLANKDELNNLAEIIKKQGGTYSTHIREESKDIVKSLSEAIGVARKTGVNLHISHLKIVGEKNWHLIDDVIKMIDGAREEGVNVNFDVYPYTYTGTVLYTLLPDWVSEGGKGMLLSRLKDPKTREKLIKEMQENEVEYDKVTIAISSLDKTLSSRKIIDIAKMQEKSVEETILDVLVASSGRVITLMNTLSEDNLMELMKHPASMISSNGSGYNVDHKNSSELVHPRNFGSFVRVLSRYVQEKRILSWEEAIHKMSGLPAKKFKIDGRGTIREGNFADILVLNPDTIDDASSIENPYRYAKGVDNMLINGETVVWEGKYTKERAGRIIKL